MSLCTVSVTRSSKPTTGAVPSWSATAISMIAASFSSKTPPRTRGSTPRWRGLAIHDETPAGSAVSASGAGCSAQDGSSQATRTAAAMAMTAHTRVAMR